MIEDIGPSCRRLLSNIFNEFRSIPENFDHWMKSDPWFVLHRMPNRSVNHFRPEISIHGSPVAIAISDSDDEPSSPFGPGKSASAAAPLRMN
jgi:hypothetical protein